MPSGQQATEMPTVNMQRVSLCSLNLVGYSLCSSISPVTRRRGSCNVSAHRLDQRKISTVLCHHLVSHFFLRRSWHPGCQTSSHKARIKPEHTPWSAGWGGRDSHAKGRQLQAGSSFSFSCTHPLLKHLRAEAEVIEYLANASRLWSRVCSALSLAFCAAFVVTSQKG